MNEAFPEKSLFLFLNPLFVFKSGRENPFPMAEFVKKIAKNDVNGVNNAKIK